MWDKMDIPYTEEEVTAFNTELNTGELSVAVALKDFIIDNCKPTEVMNLRVLNRTTKTYCNKFDIVGKLLLSTTCTTLEVSLSSGYTIS